MAPQSRLFAAFTAFWTLCGVLSVAAMWTSIELGTVRISGNARGLTQIVRMQIPPWIAVALLTPAVVLWAQWVARFGWRTAVAGYAAGLLVFSALYALLSINIFLLYDLRATWPEWRTLFGRMAGSAALATIKYVVIVGITAAVGYYRESEERRVLALELARRRAELERDLASAQLTSLKQQLQPHFLFNTLNAVSGLMDEPAAARRVLARLGDLLRLSLERSDAVHATLGEELDFADRYLEVEQARLGERLRSRYDVPAALLLARIPSFALQPLVENAVRHGISRCADGGRIHVHAACRGDRLEVRVTNDAPAGAVVSRDGIGLRTLRARLISLYGSAAELDARFDTSGHFVAMLRLPLDQSA